MALPFELLSSSTSKLTYDDAVKFRDMPAAPTERDLLPKRLKDLREKFDSGLGVTCHWATAELDGKTFRMNGQHSSHVLAEMDGAFPDYLQKHMDHYKANDLEGLIMLFRQFDPRGSGRSAGDVAGAYQGAEEELVGLNKATAKISIEGVAWHREKVDGLPHLKEDDRYSLFHSKEYHDFLIWTNEVFGKKTAELKKQEVVAAMFATWRANAEQCKIFWKQVAHGGVENDDDAPSTKLDKWLETASDQPAKVTKIRPAYYYQASIFCWNAFRRGEKVKTIKYDSSKGFLTVVE